MASVMDTDAESGIGNPCSNSGKVHCIHFFFFFFTKDLRKAKSYHIFHRQLWAGPDYDIFGPRGKLNYPTPLRSHSPTRPPACVLNIFFFTRDIF